MCKLESNGILAQDAFIWEDPVDIFIPEVEYVSKFGSPSRNGLGHQRGSEFSFSFVHHR